MKLDRVTITGADDWFSISAMTELSEEFPFVEWGILMSPTHEGQERFPSDRWMELLADECAGLPDMRVSLHLCGGYVRDLLLGKNPSWSDAIKIWDVARRVQLNFHAEPHFLDEDKFARQLFRFSDVQWIFQMDGTPNQGHFKYALDSSFDAVPLFDLSGGQGNLPTEWPTAFARQGGELIYHGYAGGLGPHTVAEQLKLIEIAALDAPIWIDMEGQVRTDGLLDLSKVRAVLEICQGYIR